MFHNSGGQESKIRFTGPKSKCWQDHCPAGGFREEYVPYLFQLWWPPSFLCLWPHHSYFCLQPHMTFFYFISFYISLIWILVTAFRSQPYKSWWSPHLKTQSYLKRSFFKKTKQNKKKGYRFLGLEGKHIFRGSFFSLPHLTISSVEDGL